MPKIGTELAELLVIEDAEYCPLHHTSSVSNSATRNFSKGSWRDRPCKFYSPCKIWLLFSLPSGIM